MFRLFFYLGGYYSIMVSGYGTERFINLCKVKNIYLWDMHLEQNRYQMKITVSDYKKIDEIMEKTGIKVDILKKYGLPFFFQGKKNRTLYFSFLLFAIFLIFISNLFVWKIEYFGNYTVSKEQLHDFLKEKNVSEGVRKSTIPYDTLEKELRKEFSVIKWCSVSISGNVLQVKIEENSLLKEEESKEEFLYSDMVASCDGTISSIFVRNGLAMVQVGDTVTKGQILVSGKIPIYDDFLQIKTYQYYDADADVSLETTKQITETLDDVYYEKIYTGRSKKTAYIKWNETELLFPMRLSYAYYDIYTTSNQLSFFHTKKLPIYYGVYEAREYYLKEQKYTEETVQNIFEEKLYQYYASLEEKGVQILEKNVKIEHSIDKWILNGDFIVSIYSTEKEYRYQVEESIP